MGGGAALLWFPTEFGEKKKIKRVELLSEGREGGMGLAGRRRRSRRKEGMGIPEITGG